MEMCQSDAIAIRFILVQSAKYGGVISGEFVQQYVRDEAHLYLAKIIHIRFDERGDQTFFVYDLGISESEINKCPKGRYSGLREFKIKLSGDRTFIVSTLVPDGFLEQDFDIGHLDMIYAPDRPKFKSSYYAYDPIVLIDKIKNKKCTFIGQISEANEKKCNDIIKLGWEISNYAPMSLGLI